MDETTQIILRIVEVANVNGYFVSSYTAEYISFKYFEANDHLLDYNLGDKEVWAEIKKYIE
jgi:hypothetical protein